MEFFVEFNSYKVVYEDIPDELIEYFNNSNYRYFGIGDIIFHSKNREDLEPIIAANKYNI